jgi:hypothetical protein
MLVFRFVAAIFHSCFFRRDAAITTRNTMMNKGQAVGTVGGKYFSPIRHRFHYVIF